MSGGFRTVTVRAAARLCLCAASASSALLGVCGTCHAVSTTFNSWSQWTDRAGNVHRSEGIYVHYYEDDPAFDDNLGFVETDADGKGSVTSDQNDAGSQLEMYAYEYPWAPNVAQVIRPGALYGTRWWQLIAPESGTYDIDENAETGVDLPIRDNTTHGGAAFGIVQAIRYMNGYYTGAFSDRLEAAGVARLHFEKVEVLYDASVTKTDYSRSNKRIRIANQYWGAWDVIMHEYGHHITSSYSMSRNPGVNHGLYEDMYENVDIIISGDQEGNATALAWDEGVATYLGLAAVKHGGIAGAFTGTPLPATDRDDVFHFFEAPNSSTIPVASEVDFMKASYSIETKHSNIRNARGELVELTRRGNGEANELSVQRAIWDFADPAGEAGTFYHPAGSDKFDFGGVGTWLHILRGRDDDGDGVREGNETFEEAWRDLTYILSQDTGKAAAGLGNAAPHAKAVARAGELLTQHTIAHAAASNDRYRDDTPTIGFVEQNSGNSAFWRALVFSDDWSSLVWAGENTAFISEFDGKHQFDVTDPLAPGFYNYVILNSPLIYRNAADFAGDINDVMYKYYWSGAVRFEIRGIPAPGVMCTFAFVGSICIVRRRNLGQPNPRGARINSACSIRESA